MNLIAWSQNMTHETAKAEGAIMVSKGTSCSTADILTIQCGGEQPYAWRGRGRGWRE